MLQSPVYDMYNSQDPSGPMKKLDLRQVLLIVPDPAIIKGVSIRKILAFFRLIQSS